MAATAVTAAFTPNPRLADALTPGIRAVLIKCCQAGIAGAREAAPVGPDRPNQPNHVHLRDSLQYDVSGNGRDQAATIIANAPHAWFVEAGTAPHVIQARGRAGGGADMLYWPGAQHPVFSVNHPGTKPQPFLRTGGIDGIRKFLATGSMP